MYEDFVKKIPANYQDEIAQGNLISLAQPVVEDQTMQYLVIVWKNYIDSNISTTCNVCMVDLLQKWQRLQPAIAAAVKARNLLATMKV